MAVADITVLALLLFHVAAPGTEAITVIIGSRLADTVIGAVLALALVLCQALWPDPQLLADRRRALQGTLAVLRAGMATRTADAGLAARSADAAWPASAGIATAALTSAVTDLPQATAKTLEKH